MKMKNNIIFGIFLTVALLLVSGDASAAVFKELAQKTAKFAGELRYLAYAISGFWYCDVYLFWQFAEKSILNISAI